MKLDWLMIEKLVVRQIVQARVVLHMNTTTLTNALVSRHQKYDKKDFYSVKKLFGLRLRLEA